jgi:hypothetical protein
MFFYDFFLLLFLSPLEDFYISVSFRFMIPDGFSGAMYVYYQRPGWQGSDWGLGGHIMASLGSGGVTIHSCSKVLP